MSFTDFRIPEHPCPECGSKLDGATNPVDSVGPQPGDATVCINCASYLVFGPGLVLEKLTPERFAALSRRERRLLSEIRLAIEEVNRNSK